MIKKLWRKIILSVLLIYSMKGNASGIFHIDINSYGTLSQSVVDSLVSQVETEVQSKLPNTDQGEFFSSMANASQMSGKDLGYDPVNPIQNISVNVGAGAAIDLNKKTINDLKDSKGDVKWSNAPGVGAQGAVSLGLRPFFLPEERFNRDRWDMFVHFFRYSLDRDDYEVKTTAAGFHGRYRLHQGKELVRWGILEWTPVYVGFGFQYSNLSGSFNDTFNKTVSDSTTGISGTFNAVGTIKVDVNTYSFPLEISSGVRFLHFFHLYGGPGVDVTTGLAKGTGTLSNSALSLTDGTGPGTATGTASLDIGTEGKPQLFTSRAMAGFQFHLWKLKIFVQGQKTFGRNLYGVQAGLRAVF